MTVEAAFAGRLVIAHNRQRIGRRRHPWGGLTIRNLFRLFIDGFEILAPSAWGDWSLNFLAIVR
jgi:hypothetical protein